MIKKILVLATIMLFSLTATASAQQYPPPGNLITLDVSVVGPGGEVTITAKSFKPGTKVAFVLGSTQLGTADADGDGVASLHTSVPSDLVEGIHTVEASGSAPDGSALVLNTSVTATGSGVQGSTGGAGGSGGLAATGSGNSRPLAQIALLAIASGAVMILVANRRRASRAEATIER